MMINLGIADIMASANELALGGTKTPHGVGAPVLRVVDGKIKAACFVYCFDKDNIDEQRYPRPIEWISLDKDGTNAVRHITQGTDDEFSDASYDELYEMTRDGLTEADEAYMDEMEEDLTRAWESANSEGGVDAGDRVMDNDAYDRYMQKLLAITPPAYRRFYTDLSV